MPRPTPGGTSGGFAASLARPQAIGQPHESDAGASLASVRCRAEQDEASSCCVAAAHKRRFYMLRYALLSLALVTTACGGERLPGEAGYDYACRITRASLDRSGVDVVALLDFRMDVCIHIVEAWNADEWLAGGRKFSCDCKR